MKIIANISRLITGIVFVFSGFVKVVDPLGTAYKFADYFVAMHLDFLIDFALVLSVVMCTAELLIGLALLFNVLPKLASWGLLLFMAVFTPLTLWLAIANPVHDCGCFGDALILSNWATFFKNVVILIFTVLVFLYRKKFRPLFGKPMQWALVTGFTIFGLSVCFYALMHLPPVDFRPYKIGANIQEGMQIPESEKNNVDVYESTFIYEKDGVKKEFTLENLPDSTWKFIDAKHILIKQGYVPPIHDFTIEPVVLNAMPQEETETPDIYDALYSFEKDGELNDYTIDEIPDNSWIFIEVKSAQSIDPENIELVYQNPDGEDETFTLFNLPGEEYNFVEAYYVSSSGNQESGPVEEGDISDMVLAYPEYTFLFISVDLDEVNIKNHDEINKLAAFCEAKGYHFLCLTASSAEGVEKFIGKYKPIYNFYNTDPITLKTIVRSNPGLVLLKEGTVLNKWSYRDLPTVDELQGNLEAYSISELYAKRTHFLIHNFIFIGLLVMTLLMWLQHSYKSKRRN
ncbi:MAG: DoxX family protein [Bacteroidales bacterium]|nr:DoxX family protein [Bacteroidales bacterium]HOY38605.1 DoxX family protein [Bacteroidales bacterium]HQP04504.1 DoxX family protein [Bacteroidales bacterium]